MLISIEISLNVNTNLVHTNKKIIKGQNIAETLAVPLDFVRGIYINRKKMIFQ